MANEVFLTDDISIKDITGVAGLTVALGGFDPDADVTKEYEGEPLSFRSVLFPSPVQTSAVLSFATTRSGSLRVDLLDVAGRAVRRLADESDAAAGMHTMTINGMRDDGRRMRPGLYFYRIVADEGRITGRFVMLK
jgi:flagellar hook assembly protein FlgD